MIVKQSLFDAKDAEEQAAFLLEIWPGPVWILKETGELLWANEEADSIAPLPEAIWEKTEYQGFTLRTLRTTWENNMSYLCCGRRD